MGHLVNDTKVYGLGKTDLMVGYLKLFKKEMVQKWRKIWHF